MLKKKRRSGLIAAFILSLIILLPSQTTWAGLDGVIDFVGQLQDEFLLEAVDRSGFSDDTQGVSAAERIIDQAYQYRDLAAKGFFQYTKSKIRNTVKQEKYKSVIDVNAYDNADKIISIDASEDGYSKHANINCSGLVTACCSKANYLWPNLAGGRSSFTLAAELFQKKLQETKSSIAKTMVAYANADDPDFEDVKGVYTEKKAINCQEFFGNQELKKGDILLVLWERADLEDNIKNWAGHYMLVSKVENDTVYLIHSLSEEDSRSGYCIEEIAMNDFFSDMQNSYLDIDAQYPVVCAAAFRPAAVKAVQWNAFLYSLFRRKSEDNSVKQTLMYYAGIQKHTGKQFFSKNTLQSIYKTYGDTIDDHYVSYGFVMDDTNPEDKNLYLVEENEIQWQKNGLTSKEITLDDGSYYRLVAGGVYQSDYSSKEYIVYNGIVGIIDKGRLIKDNSA